MTAALLCFAATFLSVFALGLQTQNVNQGHYWAAAFTSLLIGISTMYLYEQMPTPTLSHRIAYLVGGVSGITFSMWFHRSVKAWWRAWRTRKPAVSPWLKPACRACGLQAGLACQRLVCERYDDEHRDVHRSIRLH